MMAFDHYQGAALLNDGTVLFTASTSDKGIHELVQTPDSWESIQEIKIQYGLWGINSQGNLLYIPDKEATYNYDLSDFSSIQKFGFAYYGSGKPSTLLGLTNDHRLVYSGDFAYNIPAEDMENVTDFLVVENGARSLFLLYNNGRVKVFFNNYDGYEQYEAEVSKRVSRWKDIVSIQPCAEGIAGIQIDGRVVYTILTIDEKSNPGKVLLSKSEKYEKEITGWTNVVFFSSCVKKDKWSKAVNTLAVHEDGTISSLGQHKWIDTIKDNDKVFYKEMNNGTFDLVDTWKLWEEN